MNPAEKRLAVRTEDHPLDYAKFEGVIPAGQYGAGTVMVWDLGTYEPQDGISPAEQLARGKIDIVLQGEKLRGGFTLIETGERLVHASKNERWLLIKQRDKYADPSWDIESPRFDRSVLTGAPSRRLKRAVRGNCLASEESAFESKPLVSIRGVQAEDL